MSKAIVQAEGQVFLDQLYLNITGPIFPMVCSRWDINDVAGHYLSTDFLISDVRGNIMHCTVKSKTSRTFVTRLKEGNIYTINDFVVIPKTEEYRIMKKSAYIIEFLCGTTVRRSLVKSDGFVRHPFDLISFDDLQVTNNKYLIDVVGYITDVGINILSDFEYGKPKRKRLIKASAVCTPSKTSEDETKKSIAIEDSETAIDPVGSEVPEDDNYNAEVAPKKKTKRS